MEQLLSPEVVLALCSAIGAVIAAILAWVGRQVVRVLKIQESASTLRTIDLVAQQAALATEQAFRRATAKYVSPEDQSRDKLRTAMEEAKKIAPSETAAVGDRVLSTVIEAQVAKLHEAEARTPTLPPPARSAKPPPLS